MAYGNYKQAFLASSRYLIKTSSDDYPYFKLFEHELLVWEYDEISQSFINLVNIGFP